MRLLLPALIIFFKSSVVSFGSELGSDAYILSHFHYASTARLSVYQRDALPGGPRVRPCSPQVLPASPSQETKKYYADGVLTFAQTNKIHTDGQRPAKLPTMDKEGITTEGSYCKMVNNNSSTRNPETGGRWCIMARVGRFIMMSDIYHDTCGNYFRGVWETATVMDSYVHGKPHLTSPDEHAVTSSLGRYDGMERDPQFTTSFNFLPGPTGAVPVTRFLYFVAASEKDMLDTNKVIERHLAPKGKYNRCKDGTFSMERRHCVE